VEIKETCTSNEVQMAKKDEYTPIYIKYMTQIWTNKS